MRRNIRSGHGSPILPEKQHELRELLDVELARLPEKLRSAVVLCDLEGLSRREAAGRLGTTASTLRNHLANAHRILRQRLVKRGVGLSAAALAGHLASTAKATLSTATIQSTTIKAVLFAAGKSAAEIGVTTTVVKTAQGVITAMTVTKFSMIGAASLALVFAMAAIEAMTNVRSSAVRADTVVLDRFDDGSATDGSPASWTPLPQFSKAHYSVTADSYVIAQLPGAGPPRAAGVVFAEIPTLRDMSVRAQVRQLQGSGPIALLARVDAAELTGYQAGIDSNDSTFYLARK